MPDTHWNLGLRLFTVYSTVELRGFLQKKIKLSVGPRANGQSYD